MTSPNGTFRRTRAETHERLTPVTINGHTELVPEQYTVHVPVPPRDWDRIVLGGVTTVTAAVLAASVVWSTSSVGTLLSRAVEPAIAYGTATAFDLVWIVCMAVEWLSRYNPAAAVLPRQAGHVALLVAMAAVCTNGVLTGGPQGIAAGIVGSAVSALAKGTWTIVMKHTAKPLDRLTQGWVDRRMSEAGGRLALAAVERQLARVDGQWADSVAALPAGPGPDKPSGQPHPVSDDVRNAVLVALATMPDATPEEISKALAGAGFNASADTVRALSGQQDSSSGTVLHIAPHATGESIADTVRRAVRSGLDKPDMVLAAVRRVHGHDVKPDTVAKTLKRIAG